MKANKKQLVMIWFLPLIVIGWLWYPMLGYLAVTFMASLSVLSYFKKRYWCWNLCPRGAFLDIVMAKATLNNPVPRFFTHPWFRWSVLWLFMTLLILRLVQSGGYLLRIGAVFASLCLTTTLIAVVLGIATKPRAWCTFCPMGTLQEKIGSRAACLSNKQACCSGDPALAKRRETSCNRFQEYP